MTAGTALNAGRRARELDELAGGATVDLLVVGLGVTGAGVALDAASRGLSVAAVDAHDLAFGTSRWSSKLVHGGLRYLAGGHLGLAYESAVERDILLRRVAPHLITPLPSVIPLTPLLSAGQAGLARVGLAAGDLLRAGAGTPAGRLPRSRRITPVEVHRLVPAVRRSGLRGGLLGWDGQLVDDARLVVALARTAAGFGARVITRCRVEELTGGGASVRDTLTGERHRLRARAVVNATGVWADRLDPTISLRPSRGTHLVLRPGVLGRLGAGLTVPVPGTTSRFVFVLPQADGHAYLGLTDEPVEGPVPDVPEPTPAERGFLLDVVSTVLDVPLTEADVVGAFAGLRPLLAGGAGSTADLSRRHAVVTSPAGVTTIVGGKLTTYRRMARDAVDAALRSAGLPAGRCRTAGLPLVGAASPERLAGSGAPRRLVARYGAEATAVAALAIEDPGLAEPVAEGIAVTGAELLWGVRAEGALDAADLLDRRTRIGLVPADRTRAAGVAETILRRGLAMQGS
ncbi:glycerol-3-phosphate dehydrogenase [Actinoplanes sp. SE50]|uniref:glycerol-3-phosphate dehydrogenase/oxidase n=1 Tax=unclassified Actinoplanes TaxID=2626549 RepID=UPI00023EC487|nr:MULTISPECIES: glycerol-3-phosphate dehydrogenase/oxidase [unclassified Actinoplanes]AEV84658.1 glycerol-3-phosphate dehydrogenase [Actinoplanes sp. SE50/110]ATO83050.1 glycerol-3-phosphate dehydrogenase [Actinoplanes sp. SE50]SLM00458.1 glycerol-3-phosphate dehydrogenase [Actinoplanes sp. SE50/110]